MLSLLVMGIATFFIGLMPTYDAIGIWAPVILVILRIAQGIGVGGECGWPAVAGYMALMAAVTVVATWLASETYQSDIHADDHREQELVSRKEITPEARA